jgi:hypothetical protein
MQQRQLQMCVSRAPSSIGARDTTLWAHFEAICSWAESLDNSSCSSASSVLARCRSPSQGSVVHNTKEGVVIKLYILCRKGGQKQWLAHLHYLCWIFVFCPWEHHSRTASLQPRGCHDSVNTWVWHEKGGAVTGPWAWPINEHGLKVEWPRVSVCWLKVSSPDGDCNVYEQTFELDLELLLASLSRSSDSPLVSLFSHLISRKIPPRPYNWYPEPGHARSHSKDPLGWAVKFHCEGCGIASVHPPKIPSRVG